MAHPVLTLEPKDFATLRSLVAPVVSDEADAWLIAGLLESLVRLHPARRTRKEPFVSSTFRLTFRSRSIKEDTRDLEG